MSRNRKLVRAIRKYYRTIYSTVTRLRKLLLWLLQYLLLVKKKPRSANAGFVLPTVAMVSIVVVLLTMAILFRSFERSQNASNVRVNEAVLRAATPALDRAKAKISELFADPSLPRAVPSNATLYNTLTSKIDVYTLGDETPLTLATNLDANAEITSRNDGPLENKEILETAWKFPVDTDNDGKFDSYTLYGIYFRTPPQNGVNPTRNRISLDARTPPMLSGRAGNACDAQGDTSASLVGNSGWYKMQTGELKKSFFVYAATVPISQVPLNNGSPDSKYEQYKGNKSFSAIELQQDRTQLPITNNAVVYEDDLDITPGPKFRLNGRVFTNSNLMIGKASSPGLFPITLFQVSSKDSCYYERENGKIIVGGNLAGAGPVEATDSGGDEIHLFRENNSPDTSKKLSSTNKSTTDAPNQVAYNSQAYAERIDLLVTAQFARNQSTDPTEVTDNITRRRSNDPSLNFNRVRRDEIENYFRKRTRRVPFKEVLYTNPPTPATTGFTTANVLQGTETGVPNDKLRPPNEWIYPQAVTVPSQRLNLAPAQLPATDPELVERSPSEERLLADRILIGNNLPELRWDNTKQEFVGEEENEDITGQKWKDTSGNDTSNTRYRNTRVKQLADLGVTERDGFWENSAASPRLNVLDVVGGLRIVTGAGVYRSADSFLPTPPRPANNPNTTGNENAAPVVWSDAMPMVVPNPANPAQQSRGHLVMRASAVYHYNRDAYDPRNTTPDRFQTPIACVSSYYNPTSQNTATTPGFNPRNPATVEASNNGVSYAAPTTTAASITRGISLNANGLFDTVAEDVTNSGLSLVERLKYQANLVFPNGRIVNPLLWQALQKPSTENLTLAEQSAIDSTICAIQIADGSLSPNSAIIPDNAIREIAFLDARQIKAIDAGAPSGAYDLEIEERQPLEIRATQIDLNLLRTTSITGTWANEYLLPNSGVIYATRDDAQPDRSNPTSANVSATDYRLDPTRRPNAIMLINGSNLSRQNNYRPEEKGLILATDLPVYVKGNFNLHTKQEFKGSDVLNSATEWDTKFYTRSNRDSDFACRPNDPRLPNCTIGETWRPASVIADAVTLLSDNFREGYRNEGDYDLRNNQTDTTTEPQVGANPPKNATDVRTSRLSNGFWNNNFVTSTAVDDSYYRATPTAADPVNRNSSYLNNFVTPVQRRGAFSEYVMEMCFKLPVSECGATDWYVGYDADNNNTITDAERDIRSSSLPAVANATQLVAGTTARSPKAGYERFARRVAFRRTAGGNLANSGGTDLNIASQRPIPLGIVAGVVNTVAALPDSPANALWFTTTNAAAPAVNPGAGTKRYNNTDRLLFYSLPVGAPLTSQPRLEPILQIQSPRTSFGTNFGDISRIGTETERVKNTRWLSKARATTFNLVMAAGDTPARAGVGNYERNGGLHNFVRFLENWDAVDATIAGSFIQFKRSEYATAPWQVFVRPNPGDAPTVRTLFTGRENFAYVTDSTPRGEAPFYMAPGRSWGFDVALLSQNPDLFAQRFVIPSTDPPNEYYREISRDDKWVQTLLCAVQDRNEGFGNGFSIRITEGATVTTKNTQYAVPSNVRPSTCPASP